LQTSRVDASYLSALLPCLGPGCYELYSHPSTDASPDELAALISPDIGRLINKLGLRLIRYQDLS
jgi:hypothetical protein